MHRHHVKLDDFLATLILMLGIAALYKAVKFLTITANTYRRDKI